ncbi:MAG: hypothetical protein PUG48_09240 [Clostridia bacterium]|nr:hypothetical protein [Clostridia bacterium]
MAEKYLTEPQECLTDASDYSKQESKNADVRFHHMIELFTLNIVEFPFNEKSEGEKSAVMKNKSRRYCHSRSILWYDNRYGICHRKRRKFYFSFKSESV